MAEKKRRVHHLAKELMVKSKVIIEKCRAEGIDIKNHMHVVSAGLEATIKEWFSEGAHATTLEESKRVDLKSVRLKPKKKKKKTTKKTISAVAEAPPGSAIEHAATSTTAVMEPMTAADADEAPPGQASELVEQQTSSVAVAEVSPQPSEAANEGEEVDSSSSGIQTTEMEPAVDAPSVQPPPTQPEEPASPVGPQNVPLPAKLSGPKIIRIDHAEHISPPRSSDRPKRPPPPRGPALPPGKEEEDKVLERPFRGRGGKRPGLSSDPKHVRPSPHRGLRDNRRASAEQLREWKERDVLEMRDKLAQATGRGIGGLRAIEKKPGGRQRPGYTVHVKKDKVELTEPIIIRDFSRESGIPVLDIVKRLQENQGTFAGITSVIATDQAQLIAADFGIELIVSQSQTGLDKLAEEFAALPRKHLQPRPPVVTVLGHVDHGKTSLLDHIRKANVTATEAGGITQHVGAYRVKVGDNWVTFLDTPGHAAFTAMRARGADVTDVVVLVVAADDGVMPTTIEAINHARAANSTIVVALNKIDLEHDLNKLYGQLAEQGLTPSGDWGGETDVIEMSALTGQGVDKLLSHLSTLSELLELKADPTIPATGTVIEAERNDRIGNLARVIVQEGTLKTGQVIVCGATHGRVRSMRDDRGRSIQSAGPSTPVEITGLNEVPNAGDTFYVLKSARKAKDIAEEIAARNRQHDLLSVAKPTSLESVMASAQAGEIPELNVIVRADVQGSIDALKQELTSFPDDEVRLKIMHSGVGSVTESDLALAQASQSIIIAFQIVPDPAIKKKAERSGVDIRTYRIIYEVIDDIKKALEGMLSPDEKIESRGRAEVREIFKVSKLGKAAGCLVRDGVINRNHFVRVIRDSVIVKDNGTIHSLRRFKDDVKEVKAGLECGIKIADFDDVKPGDIIETFEIIKIARTLQMSS